MSGDAGEPAPDLVGLVAAGRRIQVAGWRDQQGEQVLVQFLRVDRARSGAGSVVR